jgi:hypothetical protein
MKMKQIVAIFFQSLWAVYQALSSKVAQGGLLLIGLCLLPNYHNIAQDHAHDSMFSGVVMVNTSKTDTAYLGNLVRTVYKIHQQNPEQAAKISLEGLKLAEKSQLVHTSYVFARMLGIIATRKKQLPQGNYYLGLALSYSNVNNNPYQTQQIAHLLSRNYRNSKHLDSALYFKDIESTAKERIYQLEIARAIHKLEEYIYTDEREIQLLLEENHKQQEVINKQSLEEYILGAFLVIFLVLGYLLFRNYQQRQKIKELSVNKKFEEIANITSHQLRAPVASILGLVSIFNKDDINDPVNKEVVQHLDKSAHELDKMLKEVVEKTYRDDPNNSTKK